MGRIFKCLGFICLLLRHRWRAWCGGAGAPIASPRRRRATIAKEVHGVVRFRHASARRVSLPAPKHAPPVSRQVCARETYLCAPEGKRARKYSPARDPTRHALQARHQKAQHQKPSVRPSVSVLPSLSPVRPPPSPSLPRSYSPLAIHPQAPAPTAPTAPTAAGLSVTEPSRHRTAGRLSLQSRLFSSKHQYHLKQISGFLIRDCRVDPRRGWGVGQRARRRVVACRRGSVAPLRLSGA